MSDTAEYPAIKAPEPPAELWGVWDETRGEWATDESGFLVCHQRREPIQQLIDNRRWMGLDRNTSYVPCRLIPPTP